MSARDAIAGVVLALLTTAIPAASAQTPSDEGSPAPQVETPTSAPAGDGLAVIAQGQDELLADIVGRGETFSGACQLTAGVVDRTLVRATYACATGEVIFELRHPDTAPGGAITTERFALVPISGTPPDGFAAALAARVRSREAPFEWTWLGPPARTSRPSTPVLVGAGALALVALAWALRRRAAARRTGRP